MACEVSWLGIAGELRNLYLSGMSIDPACQDKTALTFRYFACKGYDNTCRRFRYFYVETMGSQGRVPPI